MTNTDLMNVNAFENQLPDAAFAQLNPSDESLADGIGQSYGIIGYKGKVWTLRKNGETKIFTRPDDGTPSAFLDVVVLRSAGYRSKSWYEGGYTEGVTGQRPTCSSLDGVTPDVDAVKRQSEACAICPRNEFKINANGRKGKDCTDYKRLAVLVLPYMTKQLFGEPLLEPVFLRVPPASLNDLAVLGEAMTRKGFHYATYVTRIGFDMEKPHPQMTFRALQKLTDQEAPIVLQLREDPQAYRITGENEVGKTPAVGQHTVAARTVQNPQQQSAFQSDTNVGVQQRSASDQPGRVEGVRNGSVDTGAAVNEIEELKRKLAAAEAAAKQSQVSGHGQGAVGVDRNAASASAGPTSTPLPNLNFGLDQPVVEVAPSTKANGAAQATANVADTPPADESDDDLDARVAGLLQR